MSQETVSVLIPSHSASVSKMSRKNWKCWAKLLSKAPTLKKGTMTEEGYTGNKLAIGSRIPLPVGAVVLHYDESDQASVGVVHPDAEIEWIELTSCDNWVVGLWQAATKAFEHTGAGVDLRDEALAEIRRLMQQHSITVTDIVS